MPANKVRRRGSFAPLSAHYYKDDALMRAGERAEVLFTRGLAFCSEVLSDGLITDSQIQLIGIGLTGLTNRARKLCEVGLWERVDGGYNVRTWLTWNQSRDEILDAAQRDSERKRPPGADRPPEPTPPDRGSDDRFSERNPDRTPNGRRNGVHTEPERLAGGPARASSRSSSTSTSRSSSPAGCSSGGSSPAVGDHPPDTPREPDQRTRHASPCGLHPDDDRPCRRCRDRRLATEQASRDEHRAAVVASLAGRRCGMCDGAEYLLEVGRFVPVSPAAKCDHETDHAVQVARAQEVAS